MTGPSFRQVHGGPSSRPMGGGRAWRLVMNHAPSTDALLWKVPGMYMAPPVEAAWRTVVPFEAASAVVMVMPAGVRAASLWSLHSEMATTRAVAYQQALEHRLALVQSAGCAGGRAGCVLCGRC